MYTITKSIMYWMMSKLVFAVVLFSFLANRADAQDLVISVDESESDYLVTSAIDDYEKVVKRGTGTAILRTPTTTYTGDVVIEDGALYIETAGSNELRLNGSLTGSLTSASSIFFRKKGTGELYLNGDVNLARSIQVDQGLMAMTSAASRVYGDGFIVKGGGRSIVGGGHTLLNLVRIGNDGSGAFYQTNGTVDALGATSIGMNASDVGHWVMSGGEAYASNNVCVAYSSGNFGSFIQTGGLFKLNDGYFSAGRKGTAVFHLSGGTNDTRVVQGGTNARFCLGDWSGSSDVTVSGEGTLLSTETFRIGGGGSTISTNVVNINDGATIKAARFFKHRSAGAASLIVINADGGTMKPTFGYDWTNGSQSDSNYYNANPNHFIVWKKGLIVDTSESTGNNPASSMPFSFSAPTGMGVETVSLPEDDTYVNASYIGIARIVFEDATGYGASAYAEYDVQTKRHTRVIITSRGCNYSNNAKAYVESPDRTARYECSLTLSDNAGLDGELVKRGIYDLHLYATNTLGSIAIESGTLYAETDGVVPSNASVRVEYGASLRFTTPGSLFLSSFTGTGSVPDCDITITNSLRVTCEDIFSDKYANFDGKLVFADGAAFEITDPENLSQYTSSGFKTAFSANQIVGEPYLRLAGSTSCGPWDLIEKSDGTYAVGARVGQIIMVR